MFSLPRMPRYNWLCSMYACLYNLNERILCRTTTPGVPTNIIFGQYTQPTFGQSTQPTFGQSTPATPSFGAPTFGNAGMKFGVQGICLN